MICGLRTAHDPGERPWRARVGAISSVAIGSRRRALNSRVVSRGSERVCPVDDQGLFRKSANIQPLRPGMLTAASMPEPRSRGLASGMRWALCRFSSARVPGYFSARSPRHRLRAGSSSGARCSLDSGPLAWWRLMISGATVRPVAALVGTASDHCHFALRRGEDEGGRCAGGGPPSLKSRRVARGESVPYSLSMFLRIQARLGRAALEGASRRPRSK